MNVGILNSILGLLVIMFCLHILNFNYNISYLLGYFLGLINSFILNKLYTFQSQTEWTKEIVPFMATFIISYVLSHLVLVNLVEKLLWDKNIAIFLSMVVYTIIGFVLNKRVFT